MLILNRKKEGVVLVGDDEIRIKIISIKDGSVKLGIEAPSEMMILRSELFQLLDL